ncbi:hypothetical protein JCM19241_1515 [Vibrio ishigakensis]|uniref:Uncharacterized protein n=1 Tax=Vibrio ishigakensis TaxID=1481914 RepID=A0A0B8QDW4_9VIBR|nr:hypothetical protein JCM19241_1515 [Vibrio ishigakensis]
MEKIKDIQGILAFLREAEQLKNTLRRAYTTKVGWRAQLNTVGDCV